MKSPLADCLRVPVHRRNTGCPIPGHVRFISHAVRDIRSRLHDTTSGPTKKRRMDYTNRLDDIIASGRPDADRRSLWQRRTGAFPALSVGTRLHKVIS